MTSPFEEVKSGNESISGHLTRIKLTKTHYAYTPALPPKPAQVASAMAHKSGELLAVAGFCTFIYFADTSSKQNEGTINKY